MLKGCIYKISCKDANINLSYIGSTINLKNRKQQHKSNLKNIPNRPIYNYINSNGGMDNFNYEILVEVIINDRLDLFKIEQKYIKSEKHLLNCNIPCRLPKEYYNDNKIKILESQKEYYNDNRIKILLNKKTKLIKCICGATITRNHYSRHLSSKKHKQHLIYCVDKP